LEQFVMKHLLTSLKLDVPVKKNFVTSAKLMA
jgi:hypothetical protein